MSSESPVKPAGLWGRWTHSPLYLRIVIGVVLGVVVGVVSGKRALVLEIPSKLVMQLFTAVAAPLVLLAIVQALMQAELPKGSARRLITLLLTNTLVAILIGLGVANLLQPGSHAAPPAEQKAPAVEKKVADNKADDKKVDEKPKERDPFSLMLENVPKSLLGPLADEGKVLSVIFLAVAFGIALRKLKDEKVGTLLDLVNLCLRTLITILNWIIQTIPFAVFAIVASKVGEKGFREILAMGMFIVAVLVALFLQGCYYLLRIYFGSWVRPWDVLREMLDALVMAFSTASSTATMPLTYACLREKVGLRERSASLGALVGANFNNDGTALYEAMAALFISQMLNQHLSLMQQVMVMLTSVIASVGAAGIPEAGIVTMALVLDAVGLPRDMILILLTIDWFLDRCRTTINVLGDVTVSCVLDGKTREPQAAATAPAELGELSGD
jgi:Na+/H+-dicarboxylate symporter